MTFGSACFPTCAQYMINLDDRQATDSKEIHFVDDYLDSKDTKGDALQTNLEVKWLQVQDSFNFNIKFTILDGLTKRKQRNCEKF